MKRYELTFFLSPEVSKEETDKIIGGIEDIIKEDGGKVEEVKKPSRKVLPISILERKEVFLLTLFFSLDPEKLEKIRNYLLEEKRILRHMLIFSKKKTEDKEKNKAELKEINEKIDEILKVDKE